MSVRVKLCGINDPVAFDTAVELAVDWVGFVFFARSPRAVLPWRAAELSGRHAGGPGRVGLFVEPSDEDVADALSALRLDVLQIYAPAARAAELRARFGLPVWHAVAVSEAADLPADGAGLDGWVIESRAPAGAGRPGGNARAFDWTILQGWRPALPWLLAGGLNAGNVAEAIAVSGAGAVDCSSGIERAPGEKDPALMRAFVRAARGSTQAQTALQGAL
jgi:phosphoribosylanthranilate isomerase